MTDWTVLLADGFDRGHENLHAAVAGLSPEQLAHRIDPAANSIGWITWHALRVQDDHLSTLTGADQVWLADGWADRFALPYPAGAIGYGQDSDEVEAFLAHDADLLLGYADAVHEATGQWLGDLGGDDLDRVVDPEWDPPVTLGVRLVSVLDDVTQHVGQVAFLAGHLRRR